MTLSLPPQPEFGAALPVGAPEPALLAFLAKRRSASAAMLAAPAPSPAQLQDLLRLAARVPDHGKLFPWRFIVLEGEAKQRFAGAIEPLAADQSDPDKARAVLAKLKNPPVTVAVVARPPSEKKPAWEQELSAGAVCMTLVLAAQAMGYGANWITDWYAYDDRATALLGLKPGERVAGYVHLGTPAEPPLERIRPDLDAIVTRWTAP